MKRILWFLLLFTLWASIAHSESTEKRNVFDFNQRLSEYLAETENTLGLDAVFSDTENDFSYSTIIPVSKPGSEIDYYGISLPIGIVTISVPAFEVESILMDVFDASLSETENKKLFARAISVIGVLEYTRSDDYLVESIHRIDKNSPSNVIEKAEDVFLSNWENTLDRLFTKSYGEVENMHVGNYVYNLKLSTNGWNTVIYMDIEAK